MSLRLAAAFGATMLIVAAAGCGHPATGPRAVSQLRVTDPVGDVLIAEPGNTYERSTKVRNADIVATDIRRTQHNLLVALTYHDLSPFGSKQWGVSFNVTTSGPSDIGYSLYWERGEYGDRPGRWYQELHLSKGTSEDGGDSSCPHAVAAQVDYPQKTLTLRVASRCLNHNPTWLRIDDLQTYADAPKNQLKTFGDIPFNQTLDPESTPRLVVPPH